MANQTYQAYTLQSNNHRRRKKTVISKYFASHVKEDASAAEATFVHSRKVVSEQNAVSELADVLQDSSSPFCFFLLRPRFATEFSKVENDTGFGSA